MAQKMHHIQLDGEGYMLATDVGGRLLSGAVRTQRSDPFMKFVQGTDLFARQSFTFDAGAGAARIDGSNRYRRGYGVDTRGGNLILGPAPTVCQQELGTVIRVPNDEDPDTLDISVGGDCRGYAVRFIVPSGKTSILQVSVLVKRNAGSSYLAATAASVQLWTNSTDRPGTLVAGATAPFNLQNPPHVYNWIADPWKSHEWFWLTAAFPNAISVSPGGTYWLAILNEQSNPLHLGLAQDTGTVAEKNGSWAAGDTAQIPHYKLNYRDEIDAPTACFAEFRGADNILRLYAAVGQKVMYWDEPTETWKVSKYDFGADVTDLIWHNANLFAARGTGLGICHLNGATPTTTWTNLDTAHAAQCFAVHDELLWKADGANVKASPEGFNSAWGAADCSVGDPGSLVTAMISHGGKLYCIKEEGVFEIDYPEEYPDTEAPRANMVHDFRAARGARGFALDWHSGLYFPGEAGLYEWRSGVLRDVWATHVEDIEREVAREVAGQNYIEAGLFQDCVGTARGLFAAVMSPHLQRSSIWYFRNQSWHPIYQPPNYRGEYIRSLYYQSYGAGRGRLWFSKGSDIGYLEIPSWTDDRTLDPNSEFVTSGELEIPVFDAGMPNVRKHFYAVGVTIKNADATHTLTVSYQLDAARADESWIELGTAQTSPYTELPFYLEDNPVGRTIRLLLELDGTSSATPEIEQVDLLYQVLPDTIIQHQLTIRLADHVPTLQNLPDPRTAGDIWTELAALDQEDLPFIYTDELGVDHYVRAVGLTKQPARLIDAIGQGDNVEALATLTLLECDWLYEA